MKIEGNGNIQANGDVVIKGEDKYQIDPSNPNAIECPQCWNPTGRYTEYCRCGFAVRAHFDEIERQKAIAEMSANRQKWNNRGWLMTVLGGGSSFAADYFHLSSYLTFSTTIIAIIGIAILTRTR